VWDVTAATAWLLLVVHVAASPVHHGLDLHHPDAGAATPYSAGVAAMAMWILMVVAMMLPAAIPAVRHVAVKSFRWRRQRAMAEFVAVYVGIWVLFGAVVLTGLAWWAPVDTGVLVAVALTVAAVWQLTEAKRRALVRCHRASPLPPRGRPATVGVAKFAARNGAACVTSCWALMLVMAVATTGELAGMVAFTGIVSAEKLAKKPRRATRYGALLLGVAATGAWLAAAID
jgi:predicted metal-binding membrane protein